MYVKTKLPTFLLTLLSESEEFARILRLENRQWTEVSRTASMSDRF